MDWGKTLDITAASEANPAAVITDNATNIKANSAILHGRLTSLGDYGSANVSFVWGTSSGNLTQETPPQTTTSTGGFSAILIACAT